MNQTPVTVRDTCSRCHATLETTPEANMTAGYYVAAGWKRFCDPSDILVCNRCMWADPRYRACYGIVE